MGNFMDRAKNFTESHDEQVDKGLDRAGDEVDERTGRQHSERIDQGVDRAQQWTGSGDHGGSAR